MLGTKNPSNRSFGGAGTKSNSFESTKGRSLQSRRQNLSIIGMIPITLPIGDRGEKWHKIYKETQQM